MLYYTNGTVLEGFELILSRISEKFYGENYTNGNKRTRTIYCSLSYYYLLFSVIYFQKNGHSLFIDHCKFFHFVTDLGVLVNRDMSQEKVSLFGQKKKIKKGRGWE
jgi:hypothetical protein